jgi:hypothetical protein
VENLKQQQKMIALLADFYKEREAPYDAQLIFDSFNGLGGFRLQSLGAEIMELLTPDEKKQKLELYRKEMADFTNFLKSKYFAKE